VGAARAGRTMLGWQVRATACAQLTKMPLATIKHASRDPMPTVKLAGQNLFVTDNDIYSSGDVVSTRGNGAAGAAYMHIARNQFWNGGTTHWGISWKQSIYEDNTAIGASTTAMGSNYPQYAHNDGAPHVQVRHSGVSESPCSSQAACLLAAPPRYDALAWRLLRQMLEPPPPPQPLS
jgi:hypothetical protein